MNKYTDNSIPSRNALFDWLGEYYFFMHKLMIDYTSQDLRNQCSLDAIVNLWLFL